MAAVRLFRDLPAVGLGFRPRAGPDLDWEEVSPHPQCAKKRHNAAYDRRERALYGEQREGSENARHQPRSSIDTPAPEASRLETQRKMVRTSKPPWNALATANGDKEHELE